MPDLLSTFEIVLFAGEGDFQTRFTLNVNGTDIGIIQSPLDADSDCVIVWGNDEKTKCNAIIPLVNFAYAVRL